MAFAPRHPPRTAARVGHGWLIGAAILSLGLWLAVAYRTHGLVDAHYWQMISAARTMEQASHTLWSEKEKRGLLPPEEVDPNRTGMIGPEFSEITTSLGKLAAKRTVTNPDFAAALVKMIAELRLPPEGKVIVVLSGSFVGGGIAAIASLEALALEPVVVVSLGASQWGATDPSFNLLEMLRLLREKGIIRTRTSIAVLGGHGGVGRDMDPAAIEMLKASAERDGVPMLEVQPLTQLVGQLLAKTDPKGEASLVLNVGGAVVGLGSCREAQGFPIGLSQGTAACSKGTPGLVMRLAQKGLPVIHVLNIRHLAAELGLPFDPIPLPVAGKNRRIYGRCPVC